MGGFLGKAPAEVFAVGLPEGDARDVLWGRMKNYFVHRAKQGNGTWRKKNQKCGCL